MMEGCNKRKEQKGPSPRFIPVLIRDADVSVKGPWATRNVEAKGASHRETLPGIDALKLTNSGSSDILVMYGPLMAWSQGVQSGCPVWRFPSM